MMDEYQVGEVAQGEDGNLYRFRGGDAADPKNWEPASPEPQADPNAAAMARISAQGGSALGDFLRMAAHGGTFGLSDELAGLGAAMVPGGKDYAGARDAERQKIADLRATSPGASTASELAGGVAQALVPIGVGARAVKGGGGLFGSAARGALVGGAQGAAYGAGNADTNRGNAALVGGLLGAGTGAVLGAAPAVIGAAARRATGRAQRLTNAATETSGLSGDINAVRGAADDAVSAARQQHYAPLDAMGRVDDPAIAAFMKARNLSPKPRTLTELQKVLKNLKRTDGNAADELRGLMETAFPGLDAADAAYAPAVGSRNAIKLGEKVAGKPGEDIARALEPLSGDAATNAREGALFRLTDKLRGAGDENAIGVLKKADARGQLRPIFPTDAAYNRFVETLSREKSAEKVLKMLPRAVAGAGAAGGFFGYLKLSGRL